MPAHTEYAPVGEYIVRYRCYVCGIPWWERLKDMRIKHPTHNTIIAMCDRCEERFGTEGSFRRQRT
jgi:hypothetical protein